MLGATVGAALRPRSVGAVPDHDKKQNKQGRPVKTSRQIITLFIIFFLPVSLAAAPADIRANPERMEQHIKALSVFGANADAQVLVLDSI